jgi:OOP family OmpA-OmpF porin
MKPKHALPRSGSLATLLAAVSLASLSLALVPAASAQVSGWYAGAGAGSSRTDIDAGRWNAALARVGFTGVTTTTDETDTGWKLFVGYQVNRNFAVEAGYVDLGRAGVSSRFTGPAPGTIRADGRATAWHVDAVGMLPLNGSLALLGRVGIVASETRLSAAATAAGVTVFEAMTDRETSYKLGLGLSYEFTKTVGVRGEWERFRVGDGDGGTHSVDLFSVSLRVRF